LQKGALVLVELAAFALKVTAGSGEHLVPFAEGLIAGDDMVVALVGLAIADWSDRAL